MAFRAPFLVFLALVVPSLMAQGPGNGVSKTTYRQNLPAFPPPAKIRQTARVPTCSVSVVHRGIAAARTRRRGWSSTSASSRSPRPRTPALAFAGPSRVRVNWIRKAGDAGEGQFEPLADHVRRRHPGVSSRTARTHRVRVRGCPRVPATTGNYCTEDSSPDGEKTQGRSQLVIKGTQ